MDNHIRAETPADVAAIEAMSRAAFRQAEHSDGNEQNIIRGLRAAGSG